MSQPATPVTPAVKVETPVVPESGRDLLRKGMTKNIDYSEVEDATPAPVVPKVETPAPTIEKVVAPDAQAIKDAEARAHIAEIEAAKIRVKMDMLEAERVKQTAPTEEPIDLVALYEEDPVRAVGLIAEQAAKRVREETIAEFAQKNSVVEQQEARQAQVEQFGKNIEKVFADNKELSDPEHALTKHYLALEKELPYLMTIPDGPLKAIEIAKTRYELEQYKAGAATVTPAAIVEAEKKGKETEVTRQNSVRVASLVSGSSGATPQAPSATLTKEQEAIARKMRLTPEAYKGYVKNVPTLYTKESAPVRRKVR